MREIWGVGGVDNGNLLYFVRGWVTQVHAEVYLRSGCFRAIKFYIKRKNMLNKY